MTNIDKLGDRLFKATNGKVREVMGSKNNRFLSVWFRTDITRHVSYIPMPVDNDGWLKIENYVLALVDFIESAEKNA